MSGIDVVYLGGYLVLPGLQPTAVVDLFEAAHRAGARTVLDVVLPGRYAKRQLTNLRSILPSVDFFLPNYDEASRLTGERDPERQAAVFPGSGRQNRDHHDGRRGAACFAPRSTAGGSPLPSVDVVDGSGAGDAFAAGLDRRHPRGLAPGAITHASRARSGPSPAPRWVAQLGSRIGSELFRQIANRLRYVAVLTQDQIQDARRRAAQMLDEAGFVLTDEERDSIEVADFGLSELEQTGLEVVVYVNTRACLRQGDRDVPRPDLPRAPPPAVRRHPRQGGDVPLP